MEQVQMAPTSKAKIAKKIVAVMSEVEHVAKDKKNDFHGYNYASDEAIVSEIRGAMIKAGLVVVPNQRSITKEGDITTLAVEYTMIDSESGEQLTTTVYGYGQDKGDKGVYKAATGAEKYFLLKTFLIPTGDDPENEKPRPAAPAPRPQSAPAPQGNAPASGGQPQFDRKASDKQLGFIRFKLSQSPLPAETREQLFKEHLLNEYGYMSSKELTNTQVNEVLKWIESLGGPKN